MTRDGRLHLRVTKELAAEIKEYAKRKSTTVNSLVEKYLIHLLVSEEKRRDAEEL